MNGRNARHRQGLRLMIAGSLLVYRSAGHQAAVEPETRA
jgi:hypothetical protein